MLKLDNKILLRMIIYTILYFLLPSSQTARVFAAYLSPSWTVKYLKHIEQYTLYKNHKWDYRETLSLSSDLCFNLIKIIIAKL